MWRLYFCVVYILVWSYIKSMRSVGANYYLKGAKDSPSLKMYCLILQTLFFFLIFSYVNTTLYNIYVSALFKLYLYWFKSLEWSDMVLIPSVK